jgi:hypothetical protein
MKQFYLSSFLLSKRMSNSSKKTEMKVGMVIPTGFDADELRRLLKALS